MRIPSSSFLPMLQYTKWSIWRALFFTAQLLYPACYSGKNHNLYARQSRLALSWCSGCACPSLATCTSPNCILPASRQSCSVFMANFSQTSSFPPSLSVHQLLLHQVRTQWSRCYVTMALLRTDTTLSWASPSQKSSEIQTVTASQNTLVSNRRGFLPPNLLFCNPVICCRVTFLQFRQSSQSEIDRKFFPHLFITKPRFCHSSSSFRLSWFFVTCRLCGFNFPWNLTGFMWYFILTFWSCFCLLKSLRFSSLWTFSFLCLEWFVRPWWDFWVERVFPRCFFWFPWNWFVFWM